ncbi:MAG TPA: alpha/beta hydrolase [Vicinamibacterales bacterium]|jgi:proline iminopeptidase
MRADRIAVVITATLVSAVCLHAMAVREPAPAPAARQSRVAVGDASLYVREIGRGQPAIVLHGGPDFDSAYLLPDLDRLADKLRLIYYDQRGRGKSAAHVHPEEVSLASDLDDLDRIRRHFSLKAPILLGHSWGTVLALEYALRHPANVSRLILMNPAPASAADVALFRTAYIQALGSDMVRQRAIVQTAAYLEGDPETVASRYRIHFKPAFESTDAYEKLMATMKTAFVRQGKTGIVEARAVEDRLMRDTWEIDGYDLLPKLRSLNVPTLVMTADHDFIPVDVASHIADALPKAQLFTIKHCGHFAYLECPGDVRRAVDNFLAPAQTTSSRPAKRD